MSWELGGLLFKYMPRQGACSTAGPLVSILLVKSGRTDFGDTSTPCGYILNGWQCSQNSSASMPYLR